jgi:murein DD-endopeptidase MepM/ murein hydrolase activator NlpD
MKFIQAGLLYRFYILIFVFFFLKTVSAQDPEYIYESHNDSIDISNHFYDFSDSLLFIFSDTLIFSMWDTSMVHNVGKYWDELGDSVALPLLVSSGQKYVHPFKGRVTSKFGPRRGRYHYGTDVDLVTGDTVVAAFDGFVRYTGVAGGYGNVVVVRHFNGLETLYGHLHKFETETGKLVFAGDPIGLGGSTGRSSGDHLHFEVRFKGVAINPQDIIDFEKFELKTDTLVLYQKKFAPVSNTSATVSSGVPQYHTVRSGDTLSGLAVKYHTTVDALCRLNNMKRTDIIRIGQKLRVR